MEWASQDWLSIGSPGGLYSPANRNLASTPGRNGWAWSFQSRRPETAALVESTLGSSGVRSEKMARLEAALFVAEGALSVRKLVQAATLADAPEARRLLDELNAFYDHEESPFRIERVATGFQLLTQPPYSPWLDKLHQRQNELKLSSPAMETLTIVAYRQPITRADVEAVRGVQCTEMLKQLLERGLVRICGEDDSLGRPYLYDTTKKFLELFGLKSLDDMPMADTLRRKPQAQPKEPEPEDAEGDPDQLPTEDESVEEELELDEIDDAEESAA